MVTGLFEFKNGTPISNALCSFIIRNSTGPQQSKAGLTNISGMATVYFGFGSNYSDGIYELYSTVILGSTLNNTANTTFSIQRYIRPIIGIPTFIPATPGYNQTCLVNVSIEVSPAFGFVDTAQLWYLHPSLGWQSIIMTNSTYNIITGIGYYNATISAFDYNIDIASYIWVNDSLGNIGINNNSGVYYNYTIDDYWAPSIYDPTWTSPVAYLDQVNVTVRLIDDPLAVNNASGIDIVSLYYFNGVDWNNIQMTQMNGTIFDGFYTVLIPALPYGTSGLFYIWANDSANNPSLNNNSGLGFSYLIEDYVLPTITEVVINNIPITYNATANITCRVQEDLNGSGVDTVILIYNDGNQWLNISMNPIGGGNQFDDYYNAFIPEFRFNFTVQFYIWANDSVNNPAIDDNSTNYYSYYIYDFYDPNIQNPIKNDSIVEYTESVNINVQVTEPTLPTNSIRNIRNVCGIISIVDIANKSYH
jgi:hypothetical protein